MKEINRRILALSLAGAMSVGLFGCGSTSASTDTTAKATESSGGTETAAKTGDVSAAVDELKVGNVNPLSGDNALYGNDQSRGFGMAIEEINANGGVDGAKITLDEYDDQGDPQNSAKGAQKYADDEDYLAIIGSSLSNCTLAMAPIIDDAGLVEMVVSSSSPSLEGCSDYFFRMAVQDKQVGPQMAKAILNKGYKDMVVLYPNNDFGIQLSSNFVDYAEKNGGNIIESIDYNAADQDFTAILTKVKNDAPEAVALCGTVTDSALLIDQMNKLGVDAFLMGGTSLNNTKAFEIAGDAMEGVGCVSVYVASNPDEKVQEFVKKYQDEYGEVPDAFAAMAYDEGYVFAEACKKAMSENNGEIDRDSLQKALTETNYEGVTGTVTFNEKNEWVRDYLSLVAKDGEFVLEE